MNILLGLTGSMAAVEAPELTRQLLKLGDLRAITTEAAKIFYGYDKLPGIFRSNFLIARRLQGAILYDDNYEWYQWKHSGQPVEHVNLYRWANVMIIAPMTANTLGKIANGLSDNLLTSIVRTWDWNKPLVVAPSLLGNMAKHPLTGQYLARLTEWGIRVVPTQKKLRDYGDAEEATMAEITDIVRYVQEAIAPIVKNETCKS
jgi:phosphopantothenoylcysteine decarboxylase